VTDQSIPDLQPMSEVQQHVLRQVLNHVHILLHQEAQNRIQDHQVHNNQEVIHSQAEAQVLHLVVVVLLV